MGRPTESESRSTAPLRAAISTSTSSSPAAPGRLRLTTDAADDAMPSWSPDGKWIYFASSRTGRQEVWKVRATGGSAEQVTRNGGACVFPSADGTHIYYTKHDGDAELWTVAVEGGDERQLLPSVVNRDFAVVADRILLHSTFGCERSVRRVLPRSLERGRPTGDASQPSPRPGTRRLAGTHSHPVRPGRSGGRDLMLVNDFR